MDNINQKFVKSVATGNLSTVIQLLQSGADVHANNDYASNYCSREAKLDMMLKLLEYNADLHFKNDWAFRWSAKCGRLDVVMKLLKQGADINAGNKFVHSALEYAALYNHLDIVTALLGAGADVHVDNDRAFRDSCGAKHYDIVEKLLECGADIYCDDNVILKNLQKVFDEQLANTILPYCTPDDYEYFPTDYICANVTATKNASNK